MSSPSIGHNGGPSFNPDSGWVAIARAIRSHPIVGMHLHGTPCDPSKGAVQPMVAFIDLIMECRYAAGEVTNNGRKMRLERGQLLGATSWLAMRWNWTPKAVRVWLQKLEDHGMISLGFPEKNEGELEGRLSGTSDGMSHGTSKGRSKGRFANIITICNYALYQLSKTEEGQVEGRVGRQVEGQVERHVVGPKKGGLDTIYPRARETSKQDNNKNPPIAPQGDDGPMQLDLNQVGEVQPDGADPIAVSFERFWDAFPVGRKQGKGKALELFRSIVLGRHKVYRQRVKADDLIVAAERYAASRPDPKYTPMPSTWLNDGRWMDDPTNGRRVDVTENKSMMDAIERARSMDDEAFPPWPN